jgi:hypothetical protein
LQGYIGHVRRQLKTWLPSLVGTERDQQRSIPARAWAAAVAKWTQPLVTVERIRSVTGDLVRQQNKAAEHDKAKAGVKTEVPSKN